MTDRVARIIELDKQAGEAEDEASDIRWEMARLINEEIKSGKSFRKLAMEIGKNPTDVFRWSKAWERYASVTDRPSFGKATNEANPRGATAGIKATANTGGYEHSGGSGKRDGRHRRQPETEPEEDDQDEVAPRVHITVTEIDQGLNLLVNFPASAQFLSEDDRETIRGWADKVADITKRYT